MELFVGTDYAATIDAAVSGDLEVVWLSPKPYVTARERGADIEPVAKWINRDTGVAGYRSLLIARSDSGIGTIEDARGRSFAFNDRRFHLRIPRPLRLPALERGIDPEIYFSEVSLAGSHEATALAVADGQGRPRLQQQRDAAPPDRQRQDREGRHSHRLGVGAHPGRSHLGAGRPAAEPAATAVRDALLGFDDPGALAELRVIGWIQRPGR